MDVSVVSGHPAVSGPLHISKSWFSVMVSVWIREAFFDEG